METEIQPASPASIQRIVAFYEGKTHEILERYGPGPQVHYHTGFVEDPPHADASSDEQRRRLITGQERMLRYAAKAWGLQNAPFKEVLDVGCGLGGTAIFVAKEFGARVTAVTIAPSHVELVRKFAVWAAVGARVFPLLSDALAVPGHASFDAALAIDSSSSFARRPWFQCLARVLRPAGRVFIFDCFLGREEYEEPFNQHWCARIGTVAEYLTAAGEARFRLTTMEDVSHRAVHFWTTTLALMRAEAREKRLTEEQAMRREVSLRTHSLVCRGLMDRGLRHLLMSFTMSA